MEQFIRDRLDPERKSECLLQLPVGMTRSLFEEFSSQPLGPHSKNAKYMETSPLKHCHSFIIREVSFKFEMSSDKLPELPHFKALLCGLFSADEEWIGKHLMRSYFTELPALRDIYPHQDSLEYFQRVKRYHIYLSPHYTEVRVIEDGKDIPFKLGQVWSFDMTKTHSVHNNVAFPFDLVVFDILRD